MPSKFWIRAVLAAFLIALPLSISSQEVRGVITGQISDPGGAVLPAAKITVQEAGTGVAIQTKSNHDGLYEVPFLLPGSYTVAVEAAGFERTVHQNIRVDSGARVTVDLTLTVGAATTTVDVPSGTPLVETTNTDISQLIPQEVVTDVAASIYRNAANFVRLAPGVTGQAEGTYTSDNQTAISVNGGGGIQGGNEWVLDGMPDTVPLSTGSIVVVPSVDSVDQMKVNATMLDASLGHTTGGAVVTVTKAGTNKFHGTIYGFGRWKGLNANSWSNDRNHVARPDVNYYQTGYFLGGPVRIPFLYNGKDRLFFASAYERDHDVRDLSETTRVPTAAETAGDFSKTLSQSGTALTLYNPYSTTLTGTGTFSARKQFQSSGGVPIAPNLTPGPSYGTQATGTNCAIIPTSLLNPTGVGVLQTLLSESGGPNIAGTADELGVNNWYADSVYIVGQSNLSERIDYVLSDKQRLFARYSLLTRDQSPTTLILGAQQYNGSGSNIDTYLQSRHAAILNDTYIFSPTLVGTLSVGFLRRVNNDSYGAFGIPAPTSWQLPGILTSNQAIIGWPNFAIDTADTSVSLGARANLIANNGITAVVTFDKQKGTHSLKFGADWRTYQFNTASQAVAAAGQFNITQKFTASNPTSTSALQTSGSGAASLLLGLADSGSLASAAPLSLQDRYTAGYIQDNWRLRRNLTLSLGLRYDIETPYTERHNLISYGFDPNAPVNLTFPGKTLTGAIQFAGINGNPRRNGNLDTNNFGPRVGFAFSPAPNSVFRGGYALFYSPFVELLTDQGSIPTFSSSTTYIGTTNSSATAATTISNPFPNGITAPVGTAAGNLTQTGSTISFVNQHRVVPYSQQWQLSVQQGIGKGADFEVAYVGMISLKEFESFNLNDLPLTLNLSSQNTRWQTLSTASFLPTRRSAPHPPSPSTICR
ncbi:MAG: TonB-dependent receptor [Acidobacteriota bacterium]